MRDFKRMQNDPPEGVNGAPCDNDIMKWHAVIFGCAGSPLAHLRTFTELLHRTTGLRSSTHSTHSPHHPTPCPLHAAPRTLRGRTAPSS